MESSGTSLKMLEEQKLQLEILEMQRPLWHRPAFLAPLIAALISVLLGYFSGWFDLQATNLENRRNDLKTEVKAFEVEKSKLDEEIKIFVSEKKEIEGAVNELTTKLFELRESNKKQKLEINNQEKEIATLQDKHINEIRDLKQQLVESSNALLRDLAEAEVSDRPSLEKIKKKLEDIRDLNETLDDSEQRVKEELLNSGILDDDGCFIGQFGEQHCTNF